MDSDRLINEMSSQMEIITGLLSGVTAEEARFKPTPGSWSILEVGCHLLDEERLDFRTRLEITLDKTGEKWPPIDPVGWVSQRRYNERDLAEVLDQLCQERAASLAWLHGLTDPNWDAVYEAPFGKIKAGDLLVSWAMHDLLHIRQLVELRRERLLNLTAGNSVIYAGDW